MKLDRLDFVRATYWLGAWSGVFAAVQLLVPTDASVLGLPGLRSPGAAGQPAIYAAVLVLGWSAVLVWGHLRTRERRLLLVIECVVLLGLALANVVLGATGTIAWAHLAVPLATQSVLAMMFAAAFVIARQAAHERGVA